ncbi:hypothetical protein E8E13_008389 [Curvularia kusanoi]|uniref:Thymidylate kinase n=1 Tax=Curvularia kusanoi TaxID=90978 RepID=A0A9P4WAT9_CURKU|nr:hypothetical protein E8E13_008389 [Curvularia kusanoi]
MATFTRQPFGDISAPRLQALGSSKNRQNALSPIASQFVCPLKPSAAASIGKRQREPEPEIFEDEDCENADPVAQGSPPKKSCTASDAIVKPARFSMVTASPARPSSSVSASASASPASPAPSTRKSVSSPNTARSTPITHSRGSPKNKRLSAISKRRASSSPFRRVDPPSFSQSSALPFSIDAALSGTISNYTPKAPLAKATTPPAPVAPQPTSALEDSMPKSWFFEIHEDTPEQEAANMMQHSASVLDISSELDAATKARNDDALRGKENIPPPGFKTSQPQQSATVDDDLGEETEIEAEAEVEIEHTKKHRRRKLTPHDDMDQDRTPLGDLPPSEFYGKGCDAASYVTVDAGIERPSGLSKEVVALEVFEDEEELREGGAAVQQGEGEACALDGAVVEAGEES